jgi:PTS system cellobiose-specific IIA component
MPLEIPLKEEITNISCEIIALAGSAKSAFIESIRAAKDGDLNKAKELFDIGSGQFLQAHEIHANLIKRFADGDEIEMNILLVHAECLLTSAEDFKVISREIVEFAERNKK